MKKSKNNTWKRIAAGALSVALVAGALPANVGGLLTGGNGLVAHADFNYSDITAETLNNMGFEDLYGLAQAIKDYAYTENSEAMEEGNINLVQAYESIMQALGTAMYNANVDMQEEREDDAVATLKAAILNAVTRLKTLEGTIPDYGTITEQYLNSLTNYELNFLANLIRDYANEQREINLGNDDLYDAYSGIYGDLGDDISEANEATNEDTKASLLKNGILNAVAALQSLAYDSEPDVIDISQATITFNADNTVDYITVGGNNITDLSGFDITYGAENSHEATTPPTEGGVYYAYVTAKQENTSYTGEAKAQFTVIEPVVAGTDFTFPTLAEGFDFDGDVHSLFTEDGALTEDGVEKGLDEENSSFRYAVLTQDNIGDAMTSYLATTNMTPDEQQAMFVSIAPYLAGQTTELTPEQQKVVDGAYNYVINNYPADSLMLRNSNTYYVFGKLVVDGLDDYYGSSKAAYIGKVTVAQATLEYTAPTGANIFYDGTEKTLIPDANLGTITYDQNIEESNGVHFEYMVGNWIEGNAGATLDVTTLKPGDVIVPTGENGFKIANNFAIKRGGATVMASENLNETKSIKIQGDKLIVTSDTAEVPSWSKYLADYDAIEVVSYNADSKTLIFEFVNTNDLWSPDVPTRTDVGEYNIRWRIVGTNNYAGTAPATITSNIIEAKSMVTLSNLGDSVVAYNTTAVDPVSDEAQNVFELEGGKSYKIYTNKSIYDNGVFDDLDISMQTNKKFNTIPYQYCYTINIPEEPAPTYLLAHTNKFKGTNPDNDPTKMNELYVGDGTEKPELVAVLKGKGTYYYGDTPSLDDVEFTAAGLAYKDKIVRVNDIYFTLNGNKVENDALQVGVEYIMTAYVSVDESGDFNDEDTESGALYLKKKVTLAERPLYLCDAYLVDEGKDFENADFNAEQPESATNKKYNATKLDVVQDTDETGAPIVGKYHVEVPAGTFTYDGKEKAPVIKLVNPGNGDILTAKNFAVKEGNTGFKGTNAGSYTFGLEALPSTEATADTEAFVNNYVEELTVNWQIKKAVVNADAIDAKAIDNIVYDAEKLKTADDFTFAAKMTEGENPQPVDPKAAALLADSATAISEPVFGYTPDYTETLGVEAAAISMQQSGYDMAMDEEDEETAAGALNIIETEVLPLIANKYIDGGMGFWQQSSEYFNYKVSYNGAAEIDVYEISFQDGALTYKTSEDADSITLATLAEGEHLQIAAATLDADGEGATLHYVINKTPTDGTSAGLHKATFTITNPNYEDITIKDVDALIAKRKVTITPSEENNRVYGYEDIPMSYDEEEGYKPGKILQNELKGGFELAKTKTEGDKTVLVGKTGLIESDAAQLDMNTEQALQAMAPAVTMFLTIGKEKDTTNKLNPGSNDMFNFETFVNDAGTYEYVIRTPEEINAQLDAWEETIGDNEQQLYYCESIRRLINAITANYEYVLPEDSVFTLEKAPLTQDLFTLDEEAQEVLEFELVNGIPTYVFNGSEFLAPEYIADDTTFGDTETTKLNEWDYIKGGYTKATLPGDYYKVEFLATADGNYVNGDADQPWVIEANEGYSASVYVRSNKTYDGKAVTPTMTYYFDGRRISGNDVPKSFKTTYTYYKNTKTDNDDVFLGEDYISYIKANMTKLDEAPKDAGDYYVIATTTAKGYEIEDSYAHFHINRVRVHVTPSVTSKQFGEADPKITFTTDLEKQVVAGDTVNFKKEVTELVIGGYTDETKITEENPTGLVEYDGSVSDKWTYDLNGLELDNPNYTFSLSTENFTVTAHELTDENIRAKKICVAEENGFADPNNNIEVFITVGGEDKILTPGTDYEFTSNVQTQENGSYKVQIKGIGNYAGFAEADVDVIGDITDLTAEEAAKLVKITEKESEPNINPANSMMYVRCGFTAESLEEDIQVVEYGIIYTSESKDVPTSELKLENVGKNNIMKRNSSTSNFIDNGKGVSAVGFVTIKDKAGKTGTIYTGNIGGSSVVVTEYEPAQRINSGKNYVNLGFWAEINKTGYNVDEYGLLYCNDGTITDIADLTLENAETNSHITQRVKKSKTNIEDTGSGVIAVGYAKISRTDGRTAVIYTNNIGGKYGELPEYQS